MRGLGTDTESLEDRIAALRVKPTCHYVAERHTERGVGADQFRDDIVGHVVNLLLAAWQRIAEQDRLELVRLQLRIEWKIDRLGQRSGRLHAGELQGRRPVRPTARIPPP